MIGGDIPAHTLAASKVLEISGVSVSFGSGFRRVNALDDVSLSLAKGEVVGLVGRSGSGKSVLAYAAMRLGPPSMRVNGSIKLEGTELLTLSESQMRTLRGSKISLVVSNPHSALDPLTTIGNQILRVHRTHHRGTTRRTASEDALEMLAAVGIPDPERRMRAYPDQLSGGMAQRVVIAMALISQPRVVIADEPTFGLDVTIQAQVLALMRRLCWDRGVATLLITRDLGIVAQFCDRVTVLNNGSVVEAGEVRKFFQHPQHPASRELLNSAMRERVSVADPEISNAERPSDDMQHNEITKPSLLKLEAVVKNFHLGHGLVVHAVNNISLHVRAGETLALVGESGSGKTTVGRLILGLERPTSGVIHFHGVDVTKLTDAEVRQQLGPRVQMVFQEPFESLNPRMRVRDAILEPLRRWTADNKSLLLKRVQEIAESVDLSERQLEAFPHELTSGQQQRAAIARALAVSPELVVLDEPTSYLDPTESDLLLGLLARLQGQHGLSYVLISHDLAKVRWLSHRIAVMYLGQIVETGATQRIFEDPKHPYTAALLSSVLRPDPRQREELILLQGEIPSPVTLPAGCLFHTRCPYVVSPCHHMVQHLVPVNQSRQVACWRVTGAQSDLTDGARIESGIFVSTRQHSKNVDPHAD